MFYLNSSLSFFNFTLSYVITVSVYRFKISLSILYKKVSKIKLILTKYINYKTLIIITSGGFFYITRRYYVLIYKNFFYVYFIKSVFFKVFNFIRKNRFLRFLIIFVKGFFKIKRIF